MGTRPESAAARRSPSPAPCGHERASALPHTLREAHGLLELFAQLGCDFFGPGLEEDDDTIPGP